MGQDQAKQVSYRKIENLYYKKKQNKLNKKKKYISTVFRYKGPVGISKEVFILGSWNQWRQEYKLTFNKEEKSYIVVLTVPVGKHFFRYLIDGTFHVSDSHKKVPDNDGNYSNEIVVSDDTSNNNSTSSMGGRNNSDNNSSTASNSPSNSNENIINNSNNSKYENHTTPVISNELKKRFAKLPNKPPNTAFPKKFAQSEVSFVESKKTPPQLPPHLTYTPLKSKSVSNEYYDSTMLPIPLHVTLKHMYFSKDEYLSVIGFTNSYGSFDDKKFTTIQFYFNEEDDNHQNNNDNNGINSNNRKNVRKKSMLIDTSKKKLNKIIN